MSLLAHEHGCHGMRGSVVFVGAGPGDPELITLRGWRVLREADIVLYDNLVDARLLEGLEAELVFVGKRCGEHSMPQAAITELLVHFACEGKRVVRLKGGDPTVLGRTGEEALRLAEVGVPFEIVPGVSSAVAAPARAGIPVTHRGLADAVCILSAHRLEDAPDLSIPPYHPRTTLVLLMALQTVETWSPQLLERGYPADLPVAFVCAGATERQRVVVTTVSRAAADARAAGLDSPTLAVVGRVVELRERLAAYERTALWSHEEPPAMHAAVLAKQRRAPSARRARAAGIAGGTVTRRAGENPGGIMRFIVGIGLLVPCLLGGASEARAQTPRQAPPPAPQAAAPPPITMGDVVVTGSLRTRAEAWNWFEGRADDSYVYPGSLARIGLSQKKTRFDWQIEFAVPFLLGLPDDAIAPGAQGQMGLGATYFAANSNRTNVADVFLKQASVRVTGLGGMAGQSLKAGRMELIDGTEVMPGNATLAAVKRDRIAHRLLGNFAFSHVGRSFDGAQWAIAGRRLNFTAFAGRPTRGVFVVDGWSSLDINVFYGALTGQTGAGTRAGEWRVFGLGYFDRRDGVVKVDNRPLAARAADTGSIDIGTVGGHYLRSVPTTAGPVDLLVWGAAQVGSWGALDQRSASFAAEAGWQPDGLDALAPWFRGGYNYGAGDGDPNDGRHGTFFQILPTPRVYARFPFFNMMNTGDAFGEVIVRPSRSLNIRTDLHVIRLASRDDLWYAGGGAFQSSTFGFSGRPSSARTGLATLYDVSGDYRVNGYASLTVYYGRAAGRSVTDAIYARGADADFGYAELTLRF